jgi:hypothetical protein
LSLQLSLQIMSSRAIVFASCVLAGWLSSPALAGPKHRGSARAAGKDDVPAICRRSPQPLDLVGQKFLVDLQNHIVEDVVAETITEHDDGGFNTLEVRGLLREFPSAEMAFVFPAPVVVPDSSFHVRTNSSREELDRAPGTVFYIELSKALMVRSGTKLAIVLSYGAGPTGTRPKGTVWAWGQWGRYCVQRRDDGSWRAFALGAVVVSELGKEANPSIIAPPNKPLQRTQSPQRHWCNINEPLVRRPRR